MGKLKIWWKNRPYWQKGGIIGFIIIINLLMLITNVNGEESLNSCNTNEDCYQLYSNYNPIPRVICGTYESHTEIGVRCISNNCVWGCYDKSKNEFVNLTLSSPLNLSSFPTPSYPEECIESSFDCSEWTECQGILKIGSQSRTCKLKFNCKGDYKPKELQNCNLPFVQKEEIKENIKEINESNEIPNEGNKTSLENMVIIENIGLEEKIILFLKKIWNWFNK